MWENIGIGTTFGNIRCFESKWNCAPVLMNQSQPMATQNNCRGKMFMVCNGNGTNITCVWDWFIFLVSLKRTLMGCACSIGRCKEEPNYAFMEDMLLLQSRSASCWFSPMRTIMEQTNLVEDKHAWRCGRCSFVIVSPKDFSATLQGRRHQPMWLENSISRYNFVMIVDVSSCYNVLSVKLQSYRVICNS